MSATDTTVHATPVLADVNAYCHLFPRPSDVSYCGVPRSEQPRHGAGPYRPGSPPTQTPFCARCGLPHCPTCMAGAAARGREL